MSQDVYSIFSPPTPPPGTFEPRNTRLVLPPMFLMASGDPQKCSQTPSMTPFLNSHRFLHRIFIDFLSILEWFWRPKSIQNGRQNCISFQQWFLIDFFIDFWFPWLMANLENLLLVKARSRFFMNSTCCSEWRFQWKIIEFSINFGIKN